MWESDLSEEGLIDYALENIEERYSGAPVVDTGQKEEVALAALRQAVEEVGVTPMLGESLDRNSRSSTNRLVDPSKLCKELETMSNFTDITIRPINAGSLLAGGKLVYNGVVEIDFTIVKGSKGNFASLPRRSYEKDGETKWANQVYFVDEGLRNEFQETVMAAYNADNKDENTNQDAGSDGIPF